MMLTVTIDKNKDVDHYEYDTRNPLALVGTVTEIVPVNGTPLKGQIVADYPSRLVLLTERGKSFRGRNWSIGTGKADSIEIFALFRKGGTLPCHKTAGLYGRQRRTDGSETGMEHMFCRRDYGPCSASANVTGMGF